jgi:spore coat polysaccharide biosynthesis protein SpsF
MSGRRVVAILQARMGSTRLPGKVLADIAGVPMLVRTVERARRAATIDDLIVATTREPADDALDVLCRARGYRIFRGSTDDVLDRTYRAAVESGADVIVRLTADCPLLDPDLVDLTVRTFLDASPPADLVVNRLPGARTYPIGLDVEVVSFAALERAWREAVKPNQREHVLPYLYDPPGRFRVVRLDAERDYGNLRWTVDTREDLEFVRQVYARLGEEGEFGWRDVLALVQAVPDLAAINAGVQHKSHRDVG